MEENKKVPEVDIRERPILKSTSQMTQLYKLSAPLVEWIRNHHGPCTEVTVTYDMVQVRHDSMGIPFPIIEE